MLDLTFYIRDLKANNNATTFKAAAGDGLEEDTFYKKPRARTYLHKHGQTDGQTQMDRLWYETNVPFISTRKSGYEMSILRIRLQYLNDQ